MNENKQDLKPQILELLSEYLNKNKDLRFCQAVYNLTYNLANDKISKDIFYITDEEMLKLLRGKINEQ